MRYFLLGLSFLFCTLITAGLAEAHQVKSSGNIGVVIHVDPADDPIVGAQSNIILDFEDKEEKLDLEACECTIVIEKEGKEFYREAIFASHSHSVDDIDQVSVVPFVFPEKGTYTIKVFGEPLDISEEQKKALERLTGRIYDYEAFEPFSFESLIRVDRESDSSQGSLNQQNIIIAGIVLAGFAIFLLFAKLKN